MAVVKDVSAGQHVPRVGMLATVRNRHGIVSAVSPFDGAIEGRVHLVTVEYTDIDGGADDQLVWERESGARLLEPTALPDLVQSAPMPAEDFDALVRATRWAAMSAFVDPRDPSRRLPHPPIASPFHGAIQVDDFQLVPLLKALRMPRVALLLADDVGLGKTIEAGLILTELFLRRRVRRVLIICPASLRSQWRQEMQDKFCLGFDEVDRARTHALRKQLGLDANPWRVFPRIVTSYDYLKQPDILEGFRAACHVPEGSPRLPWDLLIVDEAHNLAPAVVGDDSDVSRMLALIAPFFEHRLFLTATPHNGHTRCFSGLLERLDPVRFSRTTEISAAERARIEEVVIRRLKREINARTNPPRFCERSLAAIPLSLAAEERMLSEAFQVFRKAVRAVIAGRGRGEQLAGAFAVEVLGKRLLSCPVTFADSWHRYQRGLEEAETASADEVRAAERAAREDLPDDLEAESRAGHAAQTVGAWLKPLRQAVEREMAAVDGALAELGMGDQSVESVEVDPVRDSRFKALTTWIDGRLRTPEGCWRDDERLIVFTEYKTTLDYLRRRLRSRYSGSGAIRVLYGAMDDPAEGDRDAIIAAFNDPDDAVRVLVSTDAASEGLNLQETARYLLHYDVPWNPARLEQRNGRLDRHGQARDVIVHHFATDDDADLAFLGYVVGKVETMREDLGSVGELFDAAFQRRFIDGEVVEVVRGDLDRATSRARGRAEIPRDATVLTTDEVDGGAHLTNVATELDLDPESLRSTLEVALGIRAGRPRLIGPDDRGRFSLRHPVPAEWQELVDETLRLATTPKAVGPLPAVVFDASRLIQQRNGRPIFRPQRDTALLHLGHPLFHRALALFARARFPGTADSATRWTVRRGEVPAGADALLLLTVEELAVNELRETFHHWVRTLRFPVAKDGLGPLLPHVAPAEDRSSATPLTTDDVQRARDLWDEIRQEVRRTVIDWAADLTQRLRTALAGEQTGAVQRERERFQSRQGELSHLIQEQNLARLERELEQLEAEQRQGVLFDTEQWLSELARSQRAKEEELARRRAHYEELRRLLERERERVLGVLLPRRYAMRGEAQVFPVAIEIRLPG